MDNLEAFKSFQELVKRIRSKMNEINVIIAVMSGKGGVGKSFVTANLAAALAIKGMKVGVLDADIHGPSIPKMMGLTGKTLYADDSGNILPIESTLGIKVVSMDFLLPGTETPVVWRGPIKTRVIMQFLADVKWGHLDFLLVDLPPGTGDEALTIAQNLMGVARALIVTIPSEVSRHVVVKAVTFARKLNMKILGIIENMSGFTCPKCNTTFYPLGKGGGRRIAEEMKVPFLGEIPLDPRISDSCDKGRIFVSEHPETPAARTLIKIAETIIESEKQV
ncbi:MAG: ATP-binding protein [Thermoprotei archaeon]|nr:MAG: ATP-binding protein [Thermoprotei archaeon]